MHIIIETSKLEGKVRENIYSTKEKIKQKVHYLLLDFNFLIYFAFVAIALVVGGLKSDTFIQINEQ